jgi:hypothetical protein
LKTLSKIYNKFYNQARSPVILKKYYVFTFFGFLVVIFYLGLALSKRNPYSLLIPFSFYELDLALRDSRIPIKIYLTDGKGNLFSAQRKMLLTGEYRKDISTLITQLSFPPFYEIEENVSKKGLELNLKKMPNLVLALKSIWLLKDSTLILDFNEMSVNKEINQLKVVIDKDTYDIVEEKDNESLSNIQEKEAEDKIQIQKKKMLILSSTFDAIEKTIFENFNEVKIIEFRLDGVTKKFPELDYDLSEKKSRIENTEP